MSRFQFRYQTLLDDRRLAEQQRQRDLALLLEQQQQLHQHLAIQQGKIRTGKHGLRDMLVGKIEVDHVLRIGGHNAHMLASGHGLVRRLAGLEPVINEARQRLQNAVRERKTLELLRDREEADWKRVQRRRENRANDEVGALMAAAGRAGR